MINHKCRIISKGFTLIEVLITLTIMGIISSLLMISFAQFNNNKSILEKQSRDLRALQIGFSIINQDFCQIANWTKKINSTDLGSFYTRNNDLFFSKMGYINPQFQQSRSTIQKIRYYLSNQTLYRSVYDYSGKVRYTKPILKNINTIEWTFIDQNLKTYSYWPPTQDWQNRLSRGLKLTISHQVHGRLEKIFYLPQDQIRFGI